MRFSFLTCALTIALALATTGQVHAGNKHTWRAGKPVHITTSPAGLQTFSWSPSGEILALFYQDGNIVLQNTKTNHKTAIRKVFPAESAYALKWCADGKLLVVALSERAALIDPETGLVKPMKLEEVSGAFFVEENLKAMDKVDIGGGSVELASITDTTVTIRRTGSNLSKGGKSAASPVRAVSPNGKLCMLASKQVLEVHDCAWGREASCRSLPQNFQVQKIWWLNNNDVWVSGWQRNTRTDFKTMAIKYRLNDRTLSQLHMVEAPMTKHGRMTNVYAFGDEGVIFVANESEARPACITFWNSIDRRIIQTPLTFDEQHNADEFVSPDGKTVALIYPGTVSVFDTRTGKRVLKNEDLVRTAKSDPFDMNLEWNRQSKAFSLSSAGYIQLFRLGQQ